MSTTRQSSALRDELKSVFQRAKVPTNPTIAAQILQLANDPDSNAEQFAEVISADAALSVKLLRMANATKFGQREPVTNLKRAVTLLGLRRIRMTSLGFQLVAHLDQLGDCPFDLNTFWMHSILRGCLAREIAARVVPAYADEAFLIGLLQDCGILVLVQILGKPYGDLFRRENLSPTASYLAERERFPYDHAETIYTLAQEWNLPPLIAEPLGRHHTPTTINGTSEDVDRLAAVAYVVGAVQLVEGQSTAESEPRLATYLESMGMDDTMLSRCLERAGEAYGEVASMLPTGSEAMEVTDLLDRANEHLSRAVAEAEVRIDEATAERDRMQREQQQLRSALGQYREQAAQDPLTHLLNRGALMDATLTCIRECRDRNLSVSVFFLDVDDFKHINDEYGHHIGDEVLRTLAGVISNTVVNGGFAGRYGGEEFVVIIPALDEEDCRQRARILIERIRIMRCDEPCPSEPLTCSLGVLWGMTQPGTSPAELFTAADELMYRAKTGGKNRCCFKSLSNPDEIEILAVEPETLEHDRVSREPPADITPSMLEAVVHRLNGREPTRFASMRKRDRQPMLTPCDVLVFSQAGETLFRHLGSVRNISTGGIGVVTSAPVVRGEPIEIIMRPGDQVDRPLRMGGIVAFCRHVGDGVYELGVQLVVQGYESVLREGGHANQLDWVLQAMSASQDGSEGGAAAGAADAR